MTSPRATLEEALRRTGDGAGRRLVASTLLSVELNFVFDVRFFFLCSARDTSTVAAVAISPMMDRLRQ